MARTKRLIYKLFARDNDGAGEDREFRVYRAYDYDGTEIYSVTLDGHLYCHADTGGKALDAVYEARELYGLGPVYGELH